jgi:hypothetical protein
MYAMDLPFGSALEREMKNNLLSDQKRKTNFAGDKKKAVDKGAPSKRLKRRASTHSTPPSPQQDLEDNTCIDTQCSCVDDEHVSPSPPSQVLPLTWHYYMWLHVMYDV